MPRWNMNSGGDTGSGKKENQKQWEDAVEAVIRDITVGTAQNKQPPPLVQIVIYESSV